MAATMQTLLFTRQLADLVRGGLPLHQSLTVIHRQTRNKTLQRWAGNIKSDLENGTTFSDSVKKQKGYLSSLHASLLMSGEALGSLDQSLDELSNLLEKDMEVKKKIRTVLAYPLFLLLLSLSVCSFMVLFVIPRFEPLFHELGQSLPMPTQILLTGSAWLRTYGLGTAFLLMIGVAVLAARRQTFRLPIERFLMRFEFVHDMIASWVLARWTPVMASLLQGGVPLASALRLSSQVLPFLLYKKELDQAVQKLHEGQSLSEALRSPLLPAMTTELIRVGEESGQLEETLKRLADQSQKKLDLQLKLLLSLLEPILILVMGALVSFAAFAMVLPIFEMSSTLK